MPMGKELGKFSMNATSITNLPSDGGFRYGEGNFEGTVTGEMAGAVLLTLSFKSADMKDGTYTTVAAGFLENGDVVNGEGGGSYQSIGPGKWRMRGTDVLNDGSVILVEGEMDLASRTYNGTVHAWD